MNFRFSSAPTPTTTSAAPSSVPSLFGQTTVPSAPIFGTTTSTAQSSVPSLFGQPTTTTIPSVPLFGKTTTTSAAPSSIPSLFAQATAPITTLPASLFGKTIATTTISSAPLFGQTTISSAPIFGTTTSTAQSSVPLLFGQSTTTTIPSVPLFGKTTATTSIPSAPIFGTTTSTASSSTPSFGQATTAAPIITQISVPTTATMAPNGTLFGDATTTTIPTTVKPLQFKDMEQTLAKIRIDFEQQEKQFLDEVDDINAFDIVLRQAQDKMEELGQDVDELEQEKNRFVWELDILGQQHAELEQTVQAMEKQLGMQTDQSGQSHQFTMKELINSTPADLQRQNILQLQLNLNAQFKQLDGEVGDLCEQITDLQRVAGIPIGGQLEDNGRLEELEQGRTMVDQIRQILRSQLETLVWVDKQSEALLERGVQRPADVLTLQ